MNLDQEILADVTQTLGEQPLSCTPLSGATSSDLYRLDLSNHSVVLRVFDVTRWESSAESLSKRESAILSTLRSTDLLVPRPVGTLSGNGVLMSWLPGAVVLPAEPDDSWIDELAQNLSRIHKSDLTVPFQYESWNNMRAQPAPAWWRDSGLWDAAQALLMTPPVYEPHFIHRDYHPTNVLWDNNRISGIVDWINACMGPAGIDVAHCRSNLAFMYGMRTADDFLSAYNRCNPAYEHHSYWDLEDALSMLPDTEPYPPWAEFGFAGLTSTLIQDRFQALVASAIRGHPER